MKLWKRADLFDALAVSFGDLLDGETQKRATLVAASKFQGAQALGGVVYR